MAQMEILVIVSLKNCFLLSLLMGWELIGKIIAVKKKNNFLSFV